MEEHLKQKAEEQLKNFRTMFRDEFALEPELTPTLGTPNKMLLEMSRIERDLNEISRSVVYPQIQFAFYYSRGCYLEVFSLLHR